MLIGDAQGGTGLEFTYKTFARLPMDARGRVYHTNHLLGEHPGAFTPPFFKSTEQRYKRIVQLTAEMDGSCAGEPSWEAVGGLFENHEEDEMGICRHAESATEVSTLFRIVMDLQSKRFDVSIGPPCKAEKAISLDFAGDE